ncbi:MAG: CsgG/HfaB family protein [Dysgonamonadaceae bacterium]|jgi:curli biogenesis system outer membrane secretion channel CsgG|nr:CsgG/HfaB family protein [Dysgonamonadaceae bacterium]
MKQLQLFFIVCFFCVFAGLSAQNRETKIDLQVQGAASPEKVLKRKVAIVRFSNETQYGKGIFYDKENDPMAKQALDNLSNKLASTGKFMLLERSDLDKIVEEGKLAGTGYDKIGADYVIVGSITEFGRKNVGDANLISRSKMQVAEAAVSLRLIDVSSGLIIYSEEAKGEAELKTKTTLGVGGTAGYDATLSDKAISAAISQLVENVINNLMDRPWKAYFLAVDGNDIFITGGAAQGLSVGDVFVVKEKGKSVKNPQTGVTMELPGKEVGKIKVTFMGGETPESQFSLIEFTDGKIDTNDLSKYYIEEIK